MYFFFALAVYWKFSTRNLDILQWGLSERLPYHGQGGLEPVHGYMQRPQLGPRSKSITWCTGRQDSSQAPYCMVLDPTGSTKALLSMDRCQIVVGGGDTDEGHLIQSWCWCHVFTLMLHNLFLLLLMLIKVIHIVGVTMVHWFSSFLVFSKLLSILRVFLYESYILIPY